jgi:uncharacterized protein YciI
MSAATPGRAPFRLLLAALAGGGGAAPAQPPPGPTAIPAEMRPYVPSNLRAYFVGFLVARPEAPPMTRELFIRHQAYIRRQFEAGVYRLAGPLTDSSHIGGIVVVSAPTREAALAIVAADPAAQAGLFAAEVHPALFPDLSAVRVEYPPPAH